MYTYWFIYVAQGVELGAAIPGNEDPIGCFVGDTVQSFHGWKRIALYG